jgi:hypothetical protein
VLFRSAVLCMQCDCQLLCIPVLIGVTLDGTSHVVTLEAGETGDIAAYPDASAPTAKQQASGAAGGGGGDEGGGEGVGSRPGSPAHQWPSLLGSADAPGAPKTPVQPGLLQQKVPDSQGPYRVPGDRQQPMPLKQPIKLVPAPIIYDDEDEEFERFSKAGPGGVTTAGHSSPSHTTGSLVTLQEPPKSVRGAPAMPRVDEGMALDQGTLAALGPAGAALLKSAKRLSSTVQEYQSKVGGGHAFSESFCLQDNSSTPCSSLA